MPEAHVIPLNPPDPVIRRSLNTLSSIQQYVDRKHFGLSGLARGLGRPQNELLRELVWLIQNDYVEGSPSAQMTLTAKGRNYEEKDEGGEDPDEGFHLIFQTRDERGRPRSQNE